MRPSLTSPSPPRLASTRKFGTKVSSDRILIEVNCQYLTRTFLFDRHSRQDLIRRLEHYCETEPDIFSKAVRFIDQEVSPMIARHAISGQALVRSYVSLSLANARKIGWLNASRQLLTLVSFPFQ